MNRRRIRTHPVGGGAPDIPRSTRPRQNPTPGESAPTPVGNAVPGVPHTRVPNNQTTPASPGPSRAIHAPKVPKEAEAQKNEKTLLHILVISGIMSQGSAISGRTWRAATRHAPVQSEPTTQHSRTKRLRRTPIIPACPPVFKRPVCFWRICLCVISLISGGVECFSQGTLDAAVCVSGQGPRAGECLVRGLRGRMDS